MGGKTARVDIVTLEILNPPPHEVPPKLRKCVRRHQDEMLRAMNHPTNGSGVLSVDWKGVRSADARRKVRQALSTLTLSLEVRDGCWESLVNGDREDFRGRLLVIADLSTCAAIFRDSDPHEWRRAIRTVRPYILALVRTRLDERCAELVDDIVLASENRVTVSPLRRSAPGSLRQCLSRAVMGTDPSSIVDVRFSVEAGALWLEFGDGLRAVLNWTDLDLDDLCPPLLPESVIVGEDLDTIQVMRTTGEVFDIDSAAVRGLVDEAYAAHLRRAEAGSAADLGATLRAKRRAARLTQTQLATASNLEQSLISKLENGKHRPLYDTLARYAAGLGIGVAELLRS